jgi:putative ABC transport system permease protein
MMTITQDLRYALRQLRRSPVFALTAIATLALGLGANTAIFSLLDQALLRSLPVRDPQQLVILEGTGKAWEGHSSDYGGDPEAYFSYPMYRDLEAQTRSHKLAGLIATAHAELAVAYRNRSEMATGEIVSGNYFPVLGASAFRGRLLTPADDTVPGANPAAVVSYDFWRDHLGADAAIVGRTLSINSHPYEVIGIASPGFHSAVWGERPALFVPMSMLDQVLPGKGTRLTNHKDRWMNILGRAAPEATPVQVEAALAPLWHALRAEELKALGQRSPHFTDEFLTHSRLRVLPGAQGFSYQRDTLEKPLVVVMAMAALVLVIATVNVGSLLLVRAVSRLREFSLRAALGASRGRVLTQLLTEGLLIGVLGGSASLLLAPMALRVLVHQLTDPDSGSAFSPTLDARVLVFDFALALAVSLIFSLAPALQLGRANLATTMRGTNISASGGQLTLRRVFVSLQIGLSVVLLVVSGLFVRTMGKLRSAEVGFNTGHLLSFSIAPQLAGYKAEGNAALIRRITERVSTLPGVQRVAFTDLPEFNGDSHGGNITLAGYTPPPEQQVDVQKAFVNPDFFSGMQIPLSAGRTFTAQDDATHPLVAVINETFARQYYGSARAAIGKRLVDGGGDKPVYDTEIVGVVPDFKQVGIREPVEPALFRPVEQDQGKQTYHATLLFFYVRTSIPPDETIGSIRGTMRQLDPALAVDKVRTLEEQIDENLANDRLTELLAVAFGALATLLAGVGLYGVLAYSTAQRTREIGVRIALGSSRAAVARLVLTDVLLLAGIGIGVALPCALALSRLLRSQLYGVSPADPVALASAALLVAVVAIVAALVPARRAAFVNPTEALRSE